MTRAGGPATPEVATSLVVWGGGSPDPLRTPQLEGASVVAWTGVDGAPLARAGVPFRTVAEVLGPEGLKAAEAAGRTWARVWSRLPLLDGRSLRELLEWQGTSLLWAAETFVRTATAGPLCARTAETCLRLLEALAPTEVDALSLPPTDTLLLARACTARGVLFHGPVPATGRPLRSSLTPSPGGSVARRTLSSLLAPTTAPALPSSATPGGSEGEAPLLVLVAREEDVAALRPLSESVRADLWLPTVVVPLADLPRWQTRRARRAAGEAEGFLRALLARLRGMPGLHESYVHRGVGFADLAALDLDALLLGRLPVAVSLIETAAELLAAARPRVALLVVPDRDDRRALLTACAREGVSAVALRMGAAPPDDADRADGGPQPLATLGWEDGTDAVLARLRDAARARVEAR